MSIREFIAAIPKAELNLQLTGAFRRESLLMIANQNGMPSASDDFAQWLALLDKPDFERIDEISRTIGSWVMYPEDLALAVYDIGVGLAKQNVPYAEIAVTPNDFVGSANMNIDVFIDSLNDGRDRALRAWQVDMAWVLCISRDNPRSADDVARWATGNAARRGNVIALGLTGQEDAQPIGQFRRAFATAQKKELKTAVNAVSSVGESGIALALEELQPDRVTDPWGIVKDEALQRQLAAQGIPLIVSLSRAKRHGLVETLADHPLKQLLENDVQVVLSSGMPSLYQSTLTDEYVLAHEECGLAVEDLVQLARRSIEVSYLDAEGREALLQRFDLEVTAAQAEMQASD